jgi:hypothetical protein
MKVCIFCNKNVPVGHNCAQKKNTAFIPGASSQNRQSEGKNNFYKTSNIPSPSQGNHSSPNLYNTNNLASKTLKSFEKGGDYQTSSNFNDRHRVEVDYNSRNPGFPSKKTISTEESKDYQNDHYSKHPEMQNHLKVNQFHNTLNQRNSSDQAIRRSENLNQVTRKDQNHPSQTLVNNPSFQLEGDLKYLNTILKFLFNMSHFKMNISRHSCDEQCLICLLSEFQKLDPNTSSSEILSMIINSISQHYQSGEVEFINYQNTLILFLNILHLHYLNFGEKMNCDSMCLAHKLFGFKMQFKIVCLCKKSQSEKKNTQQVVFHVTLDNIVKNQKHKWIECRHPEKLKLCPFNCSQKLSTVEYDPQLIGDSILVELEYKVLFSIELFSRLMIFKTSRGDYGLHSFVTRNGDIIEYQKTGFYRNVITFQEYPDIFEQLHRNNDEPIILSFLKNTRF